MAFLAWQVNGLVFLCLLLSLFRFMLVFSSVGLCSTLGHKEWWFHWDCLDQPSSPTPVTCKLENLSPFLLGLVFPHCGWVPQLMMELRTCGHVFCILAEFPLFNRGCLTDHTLDLLCHSGLQPPARLAFNTRVCSAIVSSLGLLCLFVYGLSGEEKQYCHSSSWPKSVFWLGKESLLCLFFVKYRDCQVQKYLIHLPPPPRLPT